MTISSIRRIALVGAAIAVMAPGARLESQGAPPAARGSADSAPALRKMVRPGLPPSAVAPAGRAGARRPPTKADSAPVLPMKRPGLPPDSVRPQAPRSTPLRTIEKSAPPPAPAKSATTSPALKTTISADVKPAAGMTMRCKDGTWLAGTPTADRCSNNGGLAMVMMAPPAAPASRPEVQQQAPVAPIAAPPASQPPPRRTPAAQKQVSKPQDQAKKP